MRSSCMRLVDAACSNLHPRVIIGIHILHRLAWLADRAWLTTLLTLLPEWLAHPMRLQLAILMPDRATYRSSS